MDKTTIVEGFLNRSVLKSLSQRNKNRVIQKNSELLIVVVDIEYTDELSHIRIINADRLGQRALEDVEEIFMSCLDHRFNQYFVHNEMHLVPEKVLSLENSHELNDLIWHAQVRAEALLSLEKFTPHILRATERPSYEDLVIFHERRRLHQPFLPVVDGLNVFAAQDACEALVLKNKIQESFSNLGDDDYAGLSEESDFRKIMKDDDEITH